MSPKITRLVGAAAIILVLIFCIWFYRAPFSTLSSIKEAALRKDTQTLSQLIDFPSFKSSIKFLISDTIDKTPERGKVSGLIAKMVVGAVAGPIVDAMVTPESIVMMFSGSLPKARGQVSDTSVGVRNDKVITSQSWEGLSIFKVRVQSAELQQHSITFVLRREGLGWKLAALER